MAEYKILNRCFHVSINGRYFCQKNDLVIEDVSDGLIDETTDYYKSDEWDKFVEIVSSKTHAFVADRYFGKDEVIYDNDFLNSNARKSNFISGKITVTYTEPEYDVSISEIIKLFDHKKALAYLLQEFGKLKESNDEQ